MSSLKTQMQGETNQATFGINQVLAGPALTALQPVLVLIDLRKSKQVLLLQSEEDSGEFLLNSERAIQKG